MKMRFMSLVAAAVLAFAASSFNVQIHAQTAQLAIMGSSAQYYEAAQADFAAKGCFYIDNNKDTAIVDTRTDSGTPANSVSLTDHDAFWVAWNKQSGSCVPNTNTVYDFYMNADSVLGLRCFFASPSCKVTVALQGSDSSFACGTSPTSVPCDSTDFATLQPFIANIPVNVAATDVRPEDGMFATLRALTPCGQPIPSSPAIGLPGSSQYLGIGDQTINANQGNAVLGAVWTVGGGNLNTIEGGNGTSAGSFNVANFAISGTDPATGNAIANGTGNSWVVYQVGAAPELVIVNPGNANGLGSLAVTNINSDTLSGFMDGTFGAVSDIIPQGFSPTEVPVNTILREYLSGTYNTFEYAIPNSVLNKSSQEAGLAAYTAHLAGVSYPQWNCTGGTVTNTNVSGPTFASAQNPLQETDAHGNVTGTRSRAIGTGNVVKAVAGVTDALGYSFWSESNFQGVAPKTMKYITVNGLDPIQEIWSDGEVPTPGNNLEGNVSFSHVKDGSYPIWSILRLVTANASVCGGQACTTLVSNLVSAEKTYVTPDFPDFVLQDQLSIVRSHFTPPGVTYPTNGGTPCNGDILSGLAESGGDVGGMVYSIQADNDVQADNGNSCGILKNRQ